MQILIKFTSLAELNRVKNANSWIRIQRKMYHLNRVFRIRDIFGNDSIDTTPFLCQYCIFSGMWGVSFSRDNAPSSIQRQVPVRYGNSVGDGTLQYGKLLLLWYVKLRYRQVRYWYVTLCTNWNYILFLSSEFCRRLTTVGDFRGTRILVLVPALWCLKKVNDVVLLDSWAAFFLHMRTVWNI